MCNILGVLFSLLLISPNHIYCLQPGEVVGEWANTLGNELWTLGKSITKNVEVRNSYKMHNVQVDKKDPEKLLDSIIKKLNTMMNKKMEAVTAIASAAELAAEEHVYNDTYENFTYYSSKYSTIFTENDIILPIIPASLQDTSFIYRNMSLDTDTHFYDIEINTEHSAVHVPTNVYDLKGESQTVIEWSEILDDVFIQNYRTDPALTWQYFGSSSGVMRHYPAMQWKQEIDLFDCRTRSWFIEAATCTKDVIILVDNSGSMTGMWNHIARFTISKILETFSNNDFINIYKFSKFTDPVEPCFNNTLVQATSENIELFKKKMKEMKPEGYANVDRALKKAFEILQDYREQRGCNEESTGCNQAIMLVTDGVASNSSQVFEMYNWLNNGTNIPVRVFTYLIGREVSNVEEITEMACANRGYYSNVQSLDEAAEKVLKYITVMARPLVLQSVDHPVSWTHAYIRDNSFEDKREKFENYRLLTSVAVPAYDRKMNRNNKTLTAELLGVAGTDVSIEDIAKLTMAYKIGVNGYAFIISNNGYILLHPDLRPVYEGKLNLNYNSMDLSEVEFTHNQLNPREWDDKILELREAMINHTHGHILGLPLKKFYDGMNRPYVENFDIYFAPITNTPFSLGIAIPDTIGHQWLSVRDEIKKNQHMGVDFRNFFEGNNWKIHPKWIYCKYHNTENWKFSSLESELLHFLNKMSEEDWKWYHQYQNYNGNNDDQTENVYDTDDWSFQKLGNKEYYCDEELVQRLISDAKVMYEVFQPWTFKDDNEEELFKSYNANLRFVATMSGLTKWEYIFDEANSTNKFEDTNLNAIEETWYKSAVLQHKIDHQSFVYSVPIFSNKTLSNITVTGSHAIFPRDAGIEAPGSVVGFQFDHFALHKRFMEITSITDCDDCMESCKSELLDCYVIDHNGFIVISEKYKDTGKFFGEIEGAVMDWLIKNSTYDNITVYDFQAVCTRQYQANNSASRLLQPFKQISSIINWMFYKAVMFLFETSIYHSWNEYFVLAGRFQDYGDDDDDDYQTTKPPTVKPTPKLRKGQTREEEEYFRELKNRPPKIIYDYEPCDKKTTLYILNQTKFILEGGFSGEIRSDCSRPFFVKHVPHSNLILIAVKTTTQTCYKKLSVTPEEIIYAPDNQPPCHKLPLNDLPRRKLSGCFNEHPLENKIFMCGSTATILHLNIYLSCVIPLILAIISIFCKR